MLQLSSLEVRGSLLNFHYITFNADENFTILSRDAAQWLGRSVALRVGHPEIMTLPNNHAVLSFDPCSPWSNLLAAVLNGQLVCLRRQLGFLTVVVLCKALSMYVNENN